MLQQEERNNNNNIIIVIINRTSIQWHDKDITTIPELPQQPNLDTMSIENGLVCLSVSQKWGDSNRVCLSSSWYDKFVTVNHFEKESLILLINIISIYMGLGRGHSTFITEEYIYIYDSSFRCH